MPKMKTHKGLAKRMRLTAGGKVIRSKKSHTSHLMSSKSAKRRRNLNRASVVSGKIGKKIKRLLKARG